ncbi:hypothetical protein EYZ11_012378 [Aspergillus tanneri]|uniref:Uncharacterized protein n=1 Tax=Aspergillus tanneri TaxID=1220188 RepID=A0A4S3J2H9_9EURO|nr:hypothetical protein EYZ11_012378 [Aspergillus tanneri]
MNRGNMTYFGSLKYYPEKSESQNPATYEALHGRAGACSREPLYRDKRPVCRIAAPKRPIQDGKAKCPQGIAGKA